MLHYLCHYLNLCGYQAVLWHSGKLRRCGHGFSRVLFYQLKALNRIRQGIKRTSPSLQTPLAYEQDLDDAIVVYPETISGNPLRASKVVRWFLHKPGHHNKRTDYGDNELYFSFQKAFQDSEAFNEKISELRFFVMLESFKQTNFGKREGTCFVLRKGRGREISHNLDGGIVVDGLSHEKMAEIFNKSEYCISYDLQTFYSHYAAVCGCKSIVVPEPDVDKEMWRPDEELRYGISYGEYDLDWAINTRSKLLSSLEQDQRISLEKVCQFADDCCEYFNQIDT